MSLPSVNEALEMAFRNNTMKESDSYGRNDFNQDSKRTLDDLNKALIIPI